MTEPHNGLATVQHQEQTAIRDRQVAELTIAEIKQSLAPRATDQEAYLFLRLCQAHGLNPFLREAYLVKYSDAQPATMVVGKEAFTQRAERHPQFDGFRAGVIVQRADALDYREGAFVPKGTALVGGWAEVYRKDRSYTFRVEVAFDEYNTKQSGWQRMPGTMIRKVALVQALREAFPTAFTGLYDAAEMRVDVDAATGEVVTSTATPAPKPPRQAPQEARRGAQDAPRDGRATPAPAPTGSAPQIEEELAQAMEERGFKPDVVARARSAVRARVEAGAAEEDAVAEVWRTVLDTLAKRGGQPAPIQAPEG